MLLSQRGQSVASETKKDAPLSIPVRHRKSVGRATTGCITCKIRRVKCDEDKPSCRRCVSTGRRCDGYAAPKTKWTRYGAPKTSRTVTCSPLRPSPNQDIEGCDSQYFDFFRSYALQDLSTVFDSMYWSRFVLQGCHYEPAIKHAVIAVGSLYEQFRFRNAWTAKYKLQEDNAAMKHYLKAISIILHNDGSQHASKVALIVCILFITFENMRGYSGAALRHIDGGIRILSQLLPKEHSSSTMALNVAHDVCVPTSVLFNMFIRLDVAASQMVIGRPLLLHDGQVPSLKKAKPLSFLELNTHLSRILSAGFKLARASWMCPAGALYDELRRRHVEELERLRSALENWSEAFVIFQDTAKLDSLSRERIQVMKVIQITMGIILDVEPAEAREYGEMVYDRYKAEFENIISLADSIVEEARRSSPIPGRSAPRYMPDTGLINPLWCVVHWCRDPYLRRRAIDVLDRAACRDGFWDSELCVRTGRMVMMLEEKDLGEVTCAADVPLWKRICVIDPKYAEDGGGALVKYWRASKSGEVDANGLAIKEVYEEMVLW